MLGLINLGPYLHLTLPQFPTLLDAVTQSGRSRFFDHNLMLQIDGEINCETTARSGRAKKRAPKRPFEDTADVAFD